MIATLFGKKKITEDRLANVFVNALLELVEQGFPEIAAELNESPEFEARPEIDPRQDEPFLMIVVAGNLMELQRHLPAGQDKRVAALAMSKFAQAIGARTSEVERTMVALQQLMNKLNHPSKNTVYAMTKALFDRYELFCFQKLYFREQRVPDPIIQQRVNKLMAFYLWDWESFNEQYRVS